METILVTGGLGFAGSHTCAALLDAGYSVVIADNLSNAKESVRERIRAVTGKEPVFFLADIRDPAALERIFSGHSIDAAIHFAGFKSVGESVLRPLDYYENNVAGTLVLLDAMERAGCRRLIFSSSATVYGDRNPVPYREEFPVSAVNPYGQTKIMVERILQDLCAADKRWTVALLRYFNPVGAHGSGLLGEDPPDIPGNLMPYLCRVAAGKLPELPVYGTDYPTPDGTGVRDYIHVEDLAQGHVAAAAWSGSCKGAEIINLGTGKGTSVLELIETFERVTGQNIPVKKSPRRPGDLPVSFAFTEKARTLLGWTAEKNLEKMCMDSWNFIRKNPDGL